MLPREARQVLAELELLMHGSVQSFNSSGRSADPDTRPQGETQPPHLHWRHRFLNEPGRLDDLIQWARQDLERLTGRYERPQVVGELPHLRNARILREGEGWELDRVARRFDVTAGFVRQLRKDARNPERDIALGLPLSPELDDRTRVLVLFQRGVSSREIAKQTGKSRSTVERWTKGQAA